MRRLPIVLAFSSLAAYAPCALPAQEHAPAFRSDSSVTRVPLEAGMRPVVLSYINGKGPFRLLVETGSVRSYLLPAAYERLVSGTSTSGAMVADTVRLGEKAWASGVRFMRIPSLGLTDIDGLLGLDAFRGTLTTIDFPKQELRLSVDTLPDANGRDVLTLGRELGFWTVPVMFPGDTVDAIIDTQSALSVSGAPALTQVLPFTTSPVTVGRARGPSVGDLPVQQARLDGVMRIGDAKLEQPIVDLVALPAPLPSDKYILGLQVLRNFSLTLDQRTGRARFERASRTVPPPPAVRSSGMASVQQPDGTRRVTHVIDGLPALTAGVKAGDVILTLNDRKASEYTETEWRAAIAGSSLLRLLVRRDSAELELRLTPALVGF